MIIGFVSRVSMAEAVPVRRWRGDILVVKVLREGDGEWRGRRRGLGRHPFLARLERGDSVDLLGVDGQLDAPCAPPTHQNPRNVQKYHYNII